MRIVLKYPTRGRPEQAASCLRAAIDRLSGGHDVRVVCATDDDDPESRAALESIDDHARARGARLEMVVVPPRSKIAACNAGTPPESEWDVLVMGSDDMWAVRDHWDAIVASDMRSEWPNFDGCLWYGDGNQVRLCTLPVMGANWHARAGSIYAPEYESMFADDEAHETAARAGRMASRLDTVLFEHRHPAYGKASADALYGRNDAPWRRDQATYLARREAGFHWPPVDLSVCICSIASRSEDLRRLLAMLNGQVSSLPLRDRRRTEIVASIDAGRRWGGKSIGAKRAACLRRACGRYVAFIDDDDWVHSEYVARVLTSIDAADRARPGGADCFGFRLMRCLPDDHVPPDGVAYTHSWEFAAARGFERPINHLNPVRRSIALAAGFDDVSWGEDSAYAARLRPMLQSQEMIVGPPMYYYLDDAATSESRAIRRDGLG